MKLAAAHAAMEAAKAAMETAHAAVESVHAMEAASEAVAHERLADEAGMANEAVTHEGTANEASIDEAVVDEAMVDEKAMMEAAMAVEKEWATKPKERAAIERIAVVITLDRVAPIVVTASVIRVVILGRSGRRAEGGGERACGDGDLEHRNLPFETWG